MCAYTGLIKRIRLLGLSGAVAILLLLALAACASQERMVAPPSDEAATPGPEPVAEVTPASCDAPVNPISPLFEISGMETTQAIITAGPAVPGDATAVIVHLEPLTNSITLTGTLTVCADDAVITSIPARQFLTTGTAVSAPASGNQLVFEPLVLPGSANVDFRVEVVSASAPGEVLAAQVLSNQAFTLTTVVPNLFYVRIDLGGTGLPSYDLVNHPGGDAFAGAVLPISEKGWFYRAANTSEIQDASLSEIDGITIAVSTPIPVSPFIASPIIHAQLSAIRNRIVLTDGIGANETLFVHGWVNEDAISGAHGAATGTSSRVGYSTANEMIGQLMYVHEFLHNVGPEDEVGLDHVVDPATATTGIAGWDVASHLPAGWTSGLTEADQQKGTGLSPIMAYRDTQDSWISWNEQARVANYFSSPALFQLLAGQFCPTGGDPREQFGQPCLSERNIILAGILTTSQGEDGLPQPFDLETTEKVELTRAFPVQQMGWPSQPTYTYSNYEPERLPFRLVFKSEQNPEKPELEIPFDARLFVHPKERSSEKPGDIVYLGYFEVVVPEDVLWGYDSIDIEFRGQRLPYLKPEEFAQYFNVGLDGDEFLRDNVINLSPLRVPD